MSDVGTPATRTISGWWALLLIPIPLYVGHLIGNAPTKAATVTRGAAMTPERVAAPSVPDRANTGEGWTSRTPGAPQEDSAIETDPGPAGDPSQPQASESQGSGGMSWYAMNDALQESRRTGKPMLIDFNADWCPPCQAMKHEAFEDPAIARAVEAAVVPVSIVDRYREEGANPPEIQELQRRFGIDAFPTLVVIEPSTGKFVKHAGFPGAAGTQAWIVDAAQAVK